MIRSKNIKYFLIALAVLLSACSSKESFDINKIDKETQLSANYLIEKGYKVLSYEGKYSFIVNSDTIYKLPYDLIWGVQKVNPIDYLNETIQTYRFIVTNHPLDAVPNNKKKKTIVWIMSCNNKIIGGYSSPNYDEPMAGDAPYSLEGKTLEEMTGLTFQEWMKKFSSP